MVDPIDRFDNLTKNFRLLQARGYVADLLIDKERQTIQARPVGDYLLDELISEHGPEGIIRKPSNAQAYYFLQSQQAIPRRELRPGSGIIRVSGGRSEGPGGTLTCFLLSKDGRDSYFAAAGHVLSNFWKDDIAGARREEPAASIYRYQKGFPATNSTRFLGKIDYLSPALRPINRAAHQELNSDIGIVKIQGKVEPVQRTTCYGSFGEWPEKTQPYKKTPEGLAVMKCGAEETHWTYAVVESDGVEVPIYGPNGQLYKLYDQAILRYKPHDQILLGQEDSKFLKGTDPPKNWSAKEQEVSQFAFAIPGDSGTMVVERESRRPVGMLIAGSVLDGRYVMTPFRTIQKFWEECDLVLRRG